MLENEERIVAESKNWRVVFVNLGEGYRGDYDPQDPEDVNLLRVDVHEWAPLLQAWLLPQDFSACTCIPADETDEALDILGAWMLSELECGKYTLKECVTRFSWVSPDEPYFQKLLGRSSYDTP